MQEERARSSFLGLTPDLWVWGLPLFVDVRYLLQSVEQDALKWRLVMEIGLVCMIVVMLFGAHHIAHLLDSRGK